MIEDYKVTIPGLPAEMDGTVIVAMSDLHIGLLLNRQWLQKRIDQVQAEQPDLVVLLGDLFEGHGPPLNELLPTLRSLKAPLGVWAVNGNHEHYGRYRSVALLKDAGIQLMRNKWSEVRPGLVLAGIEDLTIHRRLGNENDLISETLAGSPAGATILLSHTPWEYERAAQAGVNLMLSGHTHGGQIWPFGYLTKQFYPLIAGSYEVGKMTLIVCRGTGTWGPRMRLWLPGEIMRITLHSEDESNHH